MDDFNELVEQFYKNYENLVKKIDTVKYQVIGKRNRLKLFEDSQEKERDHLKVYLKIL